MHPPGAPHRITPALELESEVSDDEVTGASQSVANPRCDMIKCQIQADCALMRRRTQSQLVWKMMLLLDSRVKLTAGEEVNRTDSKFVAYC